MSATTTSAATSAHTRNRRAQSSQCLSASSCTQQYQLRHMSDATSHCASAAPLVLRVVSRVIRSAYTHSEHHIYTCTVHVRRLCMCVACYLLAVTVSGLALASQQ
eukprot:16333-Heterococcus_DN1.PRE.2